MERRSRSRVPSLASSAADHPALKSYLGAPTAIVAGRRRRRRLSHIDALEVAHNNLLRSLNTADVIILGISRTSKRRPATLDLQRAAGAGHQAAEALTPPAPALVGSASSPADRIADNSPRPLLL